MLLFQIRAALRTSPCWKYSGITLQSGIHPTAKTGKERALIYACARRISYFRKLENAW